MNSTQPQASVLAVDDDTRSLMALQGLVSDMSLRLVTAKSGDEALRCVLRQDFAVILMDARMPGVDGFEAARLIRERDSLSLRDARTQKGQSPKPTDRPPEWVGLVEAVCRFDAAGLQESAKHAQHGRLAQLLRFRVLESKTASDMERTLIRVDFVI